MTVVIVTVVQGDFFDWSPLNFLSTKSLYNLWHLEKLWASLNRIWDSAKFRGDQSKKSPCITKVCLCCFTYDWGSCAPHPRGSRGRELWRELWDMVVAPAPAPAPVVGGRRSAVVRGRARHAPHRHDHGAERRGELLVRGSFSRASGAGLLL